MYLLTKITMVVFPYGRDDTSRKTVQNNFCFLVVTIPPNENFVKYVKARFQRLK